MQALDAPGTSHPGVSFAPDLSAAAGGEGSTKAAFHKEKDASWGTHDLEASSGDIMATADRPPQSPSSSQIISS